MKRLQTTIVACALAAASLTAFAAEPTGEMMAHTCAACHGTEGRIQNEPFVPLAGMDRQRIIDSMLAYKDLKRPSTIMSHIADGYSKEQIEKMADYFAKLPAKAPAK